MHRLTSRFTQIDDEYPSCEHTFATLRIYPEALGPLDVSKRLGISPSAIRQKGREIKNSLGRSRMPPINAWFLSSETMVSSNDLRLHLDWLLGAIEPSAEQLIELQNASGVRMTVHCNWWSAGGQGGPTLWPEQMMRLSKLNLECTFDISFFGADENDDSEAKVTFS